MATVALTVTFPRVNSFVDYHDINFYTNDLNKLFDRPIRSIEVGISPGGIYHWAVFYIGRKPAKAVIDKLLADAGFKPDEE